MHNDRIIARKVILTFRALRSKNTQRIIEYLLNNPRQSLQAIERFLESQQNRSVSGEGEISAKIEELETAGIVTKEKSGHFVLCSVVDGFKEAVDSFFYDLTDSDTEAEIEDLSKWNEVLYILRAFDSDLRIEIFNHLVKINLTGEFPIQRDLYRDKFIIEQSLFCQNLAILENSNLVGKKREGRKKPLFSSKAEYDRILILCENFAYKTPLSINE